jgi:hypothetical protein
MVRVFDIKALTVAAVIAAAALLVTPRLSIAGDGSPFYCCVCAGCSVGASRQCISVEVPGFEETECTNQCATLPQGCQFLEVLEGQCALHAAECTPSPAPAASRPVLFALGALLVGAGGYLVRRRVTR